MMLFFFAFFALPFLPNAIRVKTSSKKTSKRRTERKKPKKRAKTTYSRFSVQAQSLLIPDLSNRTVRQSNVIEHQSFDCRTQSNIIELTIKFCQSNTIERSITERLVIEPNRTFDYRTIGIIERSINERRIT